MSRTDSGSDAQFPPDATAADLALQQRVAELEAQLALERQQRHLLEINNHLLANQRERAITQAELWEEVAHTDELTSIYNRRGGLRILDDIVERRRTLPDSRKAQERFEMLFIDLDGFGQINKSMATAQEIQPFK